MTTAHLPLVDADARVVRYVRISLTDRCNYRCTYCMPAEGVQLVPREDVLSFEEIERIVRALATVGVRRVRLTGGEPTVRKDLVQLVERLGALGLDDLAMTTNGHLLPELAGPLRAAGLHRLNVSVDSLDPARFRVITRRGDLATVVAGIDAARAAGFSQTKINMVVMAGVNDDEIAAVARWAWERDLVPRFIEEMPFSDGELFAIRGGVYPASRIRTDLMAAFGPLSPATARTGHADGRGLAIAGVGPARYHVVESGPFAGRVAGIISAVSEPFCDTCNRMRLSATGRLHACLAADPDDAAGAAEDLRTPLRAGATDDALLAQVRAVLQRKWSGHHFTRCGGGAPRKHMVAIGG
jgi:cyclic pyranopterin phosphate synthase